jgi:hypothetical protein
MHYRKIWETINGPIPKDEEGFSYEIHHIDGNHKNNDINNLKLVTIKEHLEIHLQQEDWFAAALIAKRIGLGPDYSSSLQRGKKRPGIGGSPKGRVPWNKGKQHSEKTKMHLSKVRKGNRYSPAKVTDKQCIELIEIYKKRPALNNDEVGKKTKNGKLLTYETAFSREYCSLYGVSDKCIYYIITGKRNVIEQKL